MLLLCILLMTPIWTAPGEKSVTVAREVLAGLTGLEVAGIIIALFLRNRVPRCRLFVRSTVYRLI